MILAVTAAAFLATLSRIQPAGMDFAPVWAAAANPEIAYDARAISDSLGYATLRPFAYPPTTIVLLWPLGLLDLTLAYGLFVGAGTILLAWAAFRAGAPLWFLILPPLALAFHAGQTSLLVGGLILSGLLSRGLGRGLLIGLAMSIKPQLCLFVPLALAPRELVTAASVPVGLAIIATAAFGPEVWALWLSSVETLTTTVEARHELERNLLQTSPFFLIVALPLLWLVRNADLPIRYGILLGCALLVSPYAMNYELALLAPAVAGRLVLSLILGLGFLAGTPILLAVLLGFALAANHHPPAFNPAARSRN